MSDVIQMLLGLGVGALIGFSAGYLVINDVPRWLRRLNARAATDQRIPTDEHEPAKTIKPTSWKRSIEFTIPDSAQSCLTLVATGTGRITIDLSHSVFGGFAGGFGSGDGTCMFTTALPSNRDGVLTCTAESSDGPIEYLAPYFDTSVSLLYSGDQVLVVCDE